MTYAAGQWPTMVHMSVVCDDTVVTPLLYNVQAHSRVTRCNVHDASHTRKAT